MNRNKTNQLRLTLPSPMTSRETAGVWNQLGVSEGTPKPKSLCLFASAGIGELGIRQAGLQTVCANELLTYRAELYRQNFPDVNMLAGDIWTLQNKIVNATRDSLSGEELFLLYATPPCQGMSSNGLGRLKWEIMQGRRAEEDERNRLIIPTMNIALDLKPRWLLFENVPGMRNTEIRDDSGATVNIVQYISQRLGEDYVGSAQVIACEDFGIPQKRKRLVTIFTRDEQGKTFLGDNHGAFLVDALKEPIRSLRDAISHLPPLDAVEGKNDRTDFHRYHFVNVLSKQKYWWIKHTPEGETAFNNQCSNPLCLFTGNRRQRDTFVDGKWTSAKDTPIQCAQCGVLLPRPVVKKSDGSYRLLKGFHSAYRRMKWDEPARAITQNFIYEASDNKIHPEQNRVLSVLEAMIVQSIDRYSYSFETDGRCIGSAKIAEVIGESVPPYLIEKICRLIKAISSHDRTLSTAGV